MGFPLHEVVVDSVSFGPEWHPLDHRVLSGRCRTHPSTLRGLRLHVVYWYAFRLPDLVDQLLSPLASRTTCRVGLHREEVWYSSSSGRYASSCRWCPRLVQTVAPGHRP